MSEADMAVGYANTGLIEHQGVCFARMSSQDEPRKHQVVLFYGAHGSGKSTTARELEDKVVFGRCFSLADLLRRDFVVGMGIAYTKESFNCAKAVTTLRCIKEASRPRLEAYARTVTDRDPTRYRYIDYAIDVFLAGHRHANGVLIIDDSSKDRPWELERIRERLGVEPWVVRVYGRDSDIVVEPPEGHAEVLPRPTYERWMSPDACRDATLDWVASELACLCFPSLTDYFSTGV